MGMIKDFKSTEFGMIPNDWEYRLFEDVMTGFSSGATPYRGTLKYYNGNVRWITSGELNYNTVTDTEEKISEEAVRETNLKIHPVGTFLIAITGLEAAGTRGRCGFVGKPSATNQSCMALYTDAKSLDNKFLYHYYVWQGEKLAFKYCQGTKQQSYTASIAKILPILLPPLPEQKAIAEVLSDTDNLIQSLEKQIAKKRLIKQGAMHKLLSPKEGWESICIGYIGESYAGGTPSTFNSDYWGGNIIWLPSGRIQNKILTLTENEITITKKGLDESATRIIKPNSVLVAITGATCGNVAYITEEVAANQSVVAITPKEQYNSKFLYYSLLTARNKILSLQTGSAQGGTNLKSIKSIKLNFPIIQEQIEISNILSAIDSELFSLEKKLLKYKSLKQGLMQNLLTGKIRLV